MKVLIITSTPNTDGLTARCTEAARQGVVDGGSRARVVNLNDLEIARCAVCNDDGWGSCRPTHRCQVADGFQELHETIGKAEAYVWLTPVYFGAPSEPLKALYDRLRRCEATKGNTERERSLLVDKPTICVAAAGGSGRGATRCLLEMEYWVRQVGATLVDAIPVTRRTADYQTETIHDAVVALVNPPPVPPVEVSEPPTLRTRRRRRR